VLRASRESWSDYHYQVAQDDVPVGRIDISQVGERARLRVGKTAYTVNREGMKVYKLAAEGQALPLAAALKEIALDLTFSVDHGGHCYVLQAVTAPAWVFALSVDGQTSGSIVVERAVQTPTEGRFPADVPLPVQMFMMTLALFARKRASDYAAMTSTLTRG
jgi:hypothetical protein